jgi:hypothetical protein
VNPEFLRLDLPSRQAGRLALAHLTVIPMDSERRLVDQTLVIEDGIITSLAPSQDLPGSVDCSGLFAMPGLADMYTHYWDPLDAPLYLAHGITLVRSVSTPFQRALGQITERGEFPGPRLVNLSATIDGVGASGRTDMPRGIAMTAPGQAAALVERFARAGYHQIKSFSLLVAENLQALAQQASFHGMAVSANCPDSMTFEEAIEAGVACFDQLHNLARGHMRADAPLPDFWDRFDPLPGTRLDFAAVRRLARLMAERRIWNVPTLVFHQRDGLEPEEGMRDPELRHAPAGAMQDWESTLLRWTRRARMDDAAKWRAAARERAKAFLQVLSIFHEERVPLLTGTDSLNPWNVQGRSLHAELANFVAAGMTPFEALHCATVGAARFSNQGSGTLEKGQRADLVLLKSDPLKSLRALDDIEAVCVNGYFLRRADLDRMLAQRGEPPIPETTIGNGNLWKETIVGKPLGRIEWRHTRTRDGWVIEERHAGSQPRRHTERRNSRLVLDGEFRLQSCEYTVDTFAGTETGTITRSGDSYQLKQREVDGWESASTLAGEPMLPSERLTATLWPLLFPTLARARTARAALDVEAGTLAVREAVFTPEGGEDWRLAVTRPSHVAEQLYRFRNGAFAGLQETMPLLWPRELSPSGSSGSARRSRPAG